MSRESQRMAGTDDEMTGHIRDVFRGTKPNTPFWEIKRARRRIELHLSSRNQLRRKPEVHQHSECAGTYKISRAERQLICSPVGQVSPKFTNKWYSDRPTEVQIQVTTALDISSATSKRTVSCRPRVWLDTGNLLLPCTWSVRHYESDKLKSETGNTMTDIRL